VTTTTIQAHHGSNALTVDHVSLVYPGDRMRPDVHALDEVDLAIAPGETVAMLGPNGSGKSTLLKIICGLLPADRGSVRVFGYPDLMSIRSRIGMVFQHDALDPHMTVYENLRDQAALYDLQRDQARARIDASLDAIGLTSRRNAPVKTLSRGLARRVDLVRALLHKPKVVLLDEPTVGLDPSAREQFLEQLNERRRCDGVTILLTTHLVDEADRQDRVVLLHEGRIVADDTPTALRRRLGAQRITVTDNRWTPPEDGLLRWRRESDGWRAIVDEHARQEAEEIVVQLVREHVPCDVAPPTLADVFEHVTGRELAGSARWNAQMRTWEEDPSARPHAAGAAP